MTAIFLQVSYPPDKNRFIIVLFISYSKLLTIENTILIFHK